MSSNIKETNESRNVEVLQLLETLTNKIKKTQNATEMLAYIKIGGDYYRYSTGIEDLMQLVAVLEVAKHDVLHQMEV